MSKRIHIVAHDAGWATRREGASRVGSIHRTQAEATQAARGTAIREQGEVVIHGRRGRIRDANSYGNDPFLQRDDSTGRAIRARFFYSASFATRSYKER